MEICEWIAIYIVTYLVAKNCNTDYLLILQNIIVSHTQKTSLKYLKMCDLAQREVLDFLTLTKILLMYYYIKTRVLIPGYNNKTFT